MHLCYVLLSPTFGMHQYTADIANRMARSGHKVSLVTTDQLPRDRYAPDIEICTPVSISGTGLSPQSLLLPQYQALVKVIISQRPQVVHFTGPHLWNVWLVRHLQRIGIPVVHTIHDLAPHHGRRLGFLLYPWNRSIYRTANKILVHGQIYRRRLLELGVPDNRVVYTPLLHLFLSYKMLEGLDEHNRTEANMFEPFMLFFGRLKAYKGVEYLLTAFSQASSAYPADFRLVLAGPGDLSKMWIGDLPPNVELRNRLISDEEALDLFRRCSLVLLPYIDATQSALIASAYFFQKPVLVSKSGALAEYVNDGETGFLVEPGKPTTLARALSEAICDPQRLRHMGSNGRRWYDQQRVAEEESLQNLYASF
jgi:glycosyltransferase involved in cell wall biosynthesis